jgi:D-amino-acid dehydrogenase
MNRKTEILVIGGGAIGICCAYYLHALGKHVTVVEKGDICCGSSYGNAGLIVPSHSIPLAAPGVISQGLRWMFNPQSPFYVKPRFQRELFSWIWKFHRACSQDYLNKSIPVLRDLSLASLALFDDLAMLDGIDFGYEKKGVLELFTTQKQFDHGVENSRLMQQHGLQNRMLATDELKQFIGDTQTAAVGGILFPQDAHLVPDRFVHQMARFLEKKGVRLLKSVEVLGFETMGRKVTAVMTTRGTISVGEIVLAGGCWSADLTRELKIKLMIEPAKGYSVTFKRPAGWPSIPLVMSEARVVLTTMEDMLRFAGTLELAGFDMSINKGRVNAILEAVPAYFPDIDTDVLELVEIWRGLRPCSPDGLPYIARPRVYDNLIIATGHGMLGISLAPITGKIVAQLASDQTPEMDIEALRIERFG